MKYSTFRSFMQSEVETHYTNNGETSFEACTFIGTQKDAQWIIDNCNDNLIKKFNGKHYFISGKNFYAGSMGSGIARIEYD